MNNDWRQMQKIIENRTLSLRFKLIKINATAANVSAIDNATGKKRLNGTRIKRKKTQPIK